MPDPEPPVTGEAVPTTTVTLTEKDVRDAARLFRLISEGTAWANLVLSEQELPGRSSAVPTPREVLIERARALRHTRRARARHFNRAMFGEPAWDILLLLYLADALEGRRAISQLSELVETPLTTVLRWVAYLEKEHLIERNNHPTDRRIVFVGMTDKGRKLMEAFLSEIGG